jgi:heterodisulfide reductase subunit C
MYFISQADFPRFLDALKSDYEVYVPVKRDRQLFYERYSAYHDAIVIGEVRAFEPLKVFFTRAREILAHDYKPDIPHATDKPFCIVGAKSCDLKGLKIHDHVFKDHDCPDPAYNKLRRENLVISADCTSAIETCFCLALGIKPYPEEDYDLNLSAISEGFVAEIGSDRGKKLVEKNASLFRAASEKMLFEKNDLRAKTTAQVTNNIKNNSIPSQEHFDSIIAKNYDSGLWEDESKTCVECAACTIICPTCHCFFLYDQKDAEKMARLRIWDSCMLKDYARVAGGANPRPRLWMRLRNRFEKKFDFFPKVAGVYACTGCGRCILGCPAKIDIRKVLSKLVTNVQSK